MSTKLIILLLVIIGSVSYPQAFDGEDIAIFRSNGINNPNKIDRVWGYSSNGSNFTRNTILNFNYGDNINGIAGGDFNGDGVEDLALLCDGGNPSERFKRIAIYISNEFLFLPMTELPIQHLGYEIMGITSGDFNNDGYDDIAFYRSFGDPNPTLLNRVIVYKSTGSSFTYMTEFTDGDLSFSGITSGDYNNDGYDDIGVSRPYDEAFSQSNDIRVFVSNGSSFSYLTSILFPHSVYNILGLASGDFNNDGYYDIALYRSFGFPTPNLLNRVIVLKSLGSSFTYMTGFTDGDFSFSGITSGDFNDDGYDDLAVTRPHEGGSADISNSFSTFSSNGSSFNFSGQTIQGAFSFLGIAAGNYFKPLSSSSNDDQMVNFIFNGNDYFPIGWYSNIDDFPRLPGIKSNGMNMIIPYIGNLENHEIGSYLTAAANNSLDVLVEMRRGAVFEIRDGSTDFSEFRTRVNYFMSYSNLLGWYILDEPTHQNPIVTPTNLEDIYNVIKTEDPDHSVFLVDTENAWTQYHDPVFPTKSYTSACDVAMWDYYPLSYGLPLLPDQLAILARTAQRVSNSVIEKKDIPIIAVLQGFGELDKNGEINFPNSITGNPQQKDPTFLELRYMSYTSLIHGARGLVYYAYYRADNTVEGRVAQIVSEIKFLNIPDIVMSASLTNLVTCSDEGMDRDNNGLFDINYIVRFYNNKYYLLASNDYNSEINGVTFNFPTSIATIKALKDIRGHNRTIYPGKYGELTDNFTKFQVHVYEITLDPYQLSKSNSNSNFTFSLKQNFPNPFNPATTIKYSLPQESFTSVKIYNTLGEEVAVIVNEVKQAGNYQIDFNASNLASGIYLYRIKAGNFVRSKKMILLK